MSTNLDQFNEHRHLVQAIAGVDETLRMLHRYRDHPALRRRPYSEVLADKAIAQAETYRWHLRAQLDALGLKEQSHD